MHDQSSEGAAASIGTFMPPSTMLDVVGAGPASGM